MSTLRRKTRKINTTIDNKKNVLTVTLDPLLCNFSSSNWDCSFYQVFCKKKKKSVVPVVHGMNVFFPRLTPNEPNLTEGVNHRHMDIALLWTQLEVEGLFFFGDWVLQLLSVLCPLVTCKHFRGSVGPFFFILISSVGQFLMDWWLVSAEFTMLLLGECVGRF